MGAATGGRRGVALAQRQDGQRHRHGDVAGKVIAVGEAADHPVDRCGIKVKTRKRAHLQQAQHRLRQREDDEGARQHGELARRAGVRQQEGRGERNAGQHADPGGIGHEAEGAKRGSGGLGHRERLDIELAPGQRRPQAGRQGRELDQPGPQGRQAKKQDGGGGRGFATGRVAVPPPGARVAPAHCTASSSKTSRPSHSSSTIAT